MAGTGDLGILLARLGIDTTDFDKAVAAVSGKLQGLGSKMTKAGKKMTMGVTLPIVGAGVAAFKMSSDFESSMSKITGLVGVAGDQVAQWSDQILTEGAEWGRPPKELADALFFVTSAGIKGAAAMDVLEMSAKASSAGLGDTTVIADLVTSAMNAYGTENLSAAQATDILVAAVREGKAEAPALAGAMGQVLPIASEMGVSFDQVGAAIAAMTRTGTDASSASMQLKNILSSILKPTDQAEQALANMGTSSQELRDKIRNDGIASALVDLKTITSEYGETAMAEVFPNIRALSGVLDLMGSNAEDNLAIFDSLTTANGALETAFNEASQTAEFSLNKALAQMKSTLVQVGDSVSKALVPIIQNLGGRLQNLGQWFDGLSEKQQSFIIKLAGILAAAGPVLLILGKMTSGIGGMIGMVGKLSSAIKLQTGVFGGLVKVVKKVSVAMMANPWIAVAAAVVAVGVAIAAVIKKMNEATAAEKALQEIQTTATQSTVKERVELERLMRVVENDRASKEQKKMALDKINAIMPDYLGYIDEEAVATGKAETAINSYIKSLEHKARMEAAQEMLVELEKERIKALQEGTDDQVKGWQKLVNVLTAGSIGVSIKALNEVAATQNAAKAQAEYLEVKNALLQTMDEESAALNKIEEQQNEYNASIDKGTETTKSIETQTSATKELGLSIETVNTNIKTLEEAYAKATTQKERWDIASQIEDWKLFGEVMEITASAINKLPSPTVEDIKPPTMPDIEDPPELQGQNVRYTSDVTSFADGIGILQDYDVAMASVDNIMSQTGITSDLLQDKIDITKNALQSMKDDGVVPTSAAFQELLEKQRQLEEEQAAQKWVEDWGSAMEQADAIIESGMENMAISLAEGIGALAAGTASAQDIWTTLLGGLGDMAIQLGKLAVTTGIAVKGIMEALKANPTTAIIGGIALIAIGSYVKNKMASIADGAGGGGEEMPRVPGLAQGGVVDSPTMVMVGEYPGAKTNKEIITPEKKLTQIFSSVLSATDDSTVETLFKAITSDLTAFSEVSNISYPNKIESVLDPLKMMFEDANRNFTDLITTKQLVGQDYELPQYTPPSKETYITGIQTPVDVNINTSTPVSETPEQELVAEVRGDDLYFMLKKVAKKVDRYGK